MTKECNVIMLPTEKESNIRIKGSNRKLVYHATKTRWLPEGAYLYVTSDDVIKEGDKVIPDDEGFRNAIWEFRKAPCSVKYWGSSKTCKKIIATTNPDLWFTDAPEMHGIPAGEVINIAKIPEPFIESYVKAYNKGERIEKVMIEYQAGYTGFQDAYIGIPPKSKVSWPIQVPKLTDNGNIVIRPSNPKNERLYTKEELRIAAWMAWYTASFALKENTTKEKFREWFNESYPQ